MKCYLFVHVNTLCSQYLWKINPGHKVSPTFCSAEKAHRNFKFNCGQPEQNHHNLTFNLVGKCLKISITKTFCLLYQQLAAHIESLFWKDTNYVVVANFFYSYHQNYFFECFFDIKPNSILKIFKYTLKNEIDYPKRPETLSTL
jgi:hypothetical protein